MVGSGKININIKFQDNKLDIKIVSCQGLKDADMIGKSDPYVKLFVLPGRHTVLKTKTMKGNLNPVFNSTFSFTLTRDQAAKKTAVFQVFDDDYGKDDTLGETRISLSSVNLVSGIDNDYSLDLHPFTTTPPVVVAGSSPAPRTSSAAMVMEQTTNYRPRNIQGVGMTTSSTIQGVGMTTSSTSRQSFHSPAINGGLRSSTGERLDIRTLNARLDDVIRKNGNFNEISDDLIVKLISKEVEDSLPAEDVTAELNKMFAFTSAEIRELAELRAENERMEVEAKYLNKKIIATEQYIQRIQLEEANIDKMIMTCQREVTSMQSERERIHTDTIYHDDSSSDGKLMDYSDRMKAYYTWFYENDIEFKKKELVDGMVERKLKTFMERSIQSPTIIWGIRRSYSEFFKLHLDNLTIEIQSFRGLLDDIIARYNDFIRTLATCDDEDREFRGLYEQLTQKEHSLFTIRQERAGLRFERDSNMFNFLSEFAAKEAAMKFLKIEWDLIVNRVVDDVGEYINQAEINRFCHSVQQADNAAASTVRHYQSTSSSSITGMKLTPDMGPDGSVRGWNSESIYESIHE